MHDNPIYADCDERVVRALIAEHPFATLVSATGAGIVASHYPVLLDDSDELAIFIHVGRTDADMHGFGSGEVLVIVAGPHGYVSPSWYSPGAVAVPTWDFVTAHLYGTPRVLDADENAALLRHLTEHFERHVERPVTLDADVLARLGPHAIGLRLPIDRVICKVKMGQDESPATQTRVVAALRRPGPYSNPSLADEMEKTLSPHASRDRTAPSVPVGRAENDRRARRRTRADEPFLAEDGTCQRS